MLNRTKIIIAGIGGVGGYFGGLLAKKYADSDVAIYFVARGAHLTQIRKEGLKVLKGEETFIAQPYLATDDVTEIGMADYIIICTKNYDLETMVEQLRPCIGKDTIILPLLNGIAGTEKIRAQLPQTKVLAGCTYIVSAIKESGVVENTGNEQKIFFGLEDSIADERLNTLEYLLKEAGIEATLSPEIAKVVWQKFIFLSSLATATSYFNKTVGQLLEENRETLASLIAEVSQLALAKNIPIATDIVTKSIAHFETLPYPATSSMHRDFMQAKPNTELESLTGYVVKQAQLLHLDTPNFNQAYAQLSDQ